MRRVTNYYQSRDTLLAKASPDHLSRLYAACSATNSIVSRICKFVKRLAIVSYATGALNIKLTFQDILELKKKKENIIKKLNKTEIIPKKLNQLTP